MRDTPIGIAMSGGVDSTACALLLRDRFRVEGFFMQLAQPGLAAQLERVRQLAGRIGIPLHVVDLRQAFSAKVLDYFSGSYHRGLTPNPCVVCNREIKFGLLMDAILAAGMTKMATGHYARIEVAGQIHRLFRGLDPTKDQSYFLSRLTQQQLARTVFPLGGRTKESTYRFVQDHGFDDFQGQESQDVCFLGNGEIGDFLGARVEGQEVEGPILSTSGRRLGTHRGLFRYTIGQRRGLGIAADAPLYVVALDVRENAVIVGGEEELRRDRIAVEALHWLAGAPPDPARSYTVRIRSTHPGAPARLRLADNACGEILFDQPQRAITPGQFAVVYDDGEVLGSGIIVLDNLPR